MLKWINVKNKLPERNERVLVVIEGDNKPEITISYWDELYSSWDENNVETTEPRWYYEGEPLFATSWYQEINFWMPLPKLPEGL
jgi:hypothetical protein